MRSYDERANKVLVHGLNNKVSIFWRDGMFTLTNIVTRQTVALPSSIQRESGRRTLETRGRRLKLTVQNYLHSVSKYTTRGA
jgi:hypothetical protein